MFAASVAYHEQVDPIDSGQCDDVYMLHPEEERRCGR